MSPACQHHHCTGHHITDEVNCRDGQLTEITPANRQGSYRVGLSHADAPLQHKGEAAKWERFWLEAEEVCRCSIVVPNVWTPQGFLKDACTLRQGLHVPAWRVSYYSMSLTVGPIVSGWSDQGSQWSLVTVPCS